MSGFHLTHPSLLRSTGGVTSRPESGYCVWDLPSGTLLHSLECGDARVIQWSWTDQYLLFKPWDGTPRYLNAETFQEAVLYHHDDRFQERNHLHQEGNILRIRLSGGREGPLFLA